MSPVTKKEWMNNFKNRFLKNLVFVPVLCSVIYVIWLVTLNREDPYYLVFIYYLKSLFITSIITTVLFNSIDAYFKNPLIAVTLTEWINNIKSRFKKNLIASSVFWFFIIIIVSVMAIFTTLATPIGIVLLQMLIVIPVTSVIITVTDAFFKKPFLQFLKEVFSEGYSAKIAENARTKAFNKMGVNEAVDRIISIYQRHPQGFVQGSGGESEQELRRIGEMLDKKGGMELMRSAHARFASKCNIYGAARNLEFMWHGIGNWQG